MDVLPTDEGDYIYVGSNRDVAYNVLSSSIEGGDSPARINREDALSYRVQDYVSVFALCFVDHGIGESYTSSPGNYPYRMICGFVRSIHWRMGTLVKK